MVTVTNLSVQFKRQAVLAGVNCHIVPGRITSFIGKSGAGKTTLLKTIAGLTQVSSGEITISSTLIASLSPQERSRHIGFVFQDFNLFGNLTVLENCIDPLLVQGVPRNAAQEQALALLSEFGLSAQRDQYPNSLSGGQQQRVAIVRALGLNPKVLLLDEPTASLDPENSALLVSILQKLAAQGMTIGLSSQDMQFVKDVFDCIYFVENGTITEYCSDKDTLDQMPAIKRFVS